MGYEEKCKEMDTKLLELWEDYLDLTADTMNGDETKGQNMEDFINTLSARLKELV